MDIKSIRLVIWDLDDTFWQGTLSEGAVEINQKNITLVNDMLDAGVVCSICSKNDEKQTKAYLANVGIQELFVFPSLFEGTPLSILKVQANGLPCVISDSVPPDVYLTDLIHPLSLHDGREKWVDAILAQQRTDAESYNHQLRGSDYAVETAIEKIYRIYEKRNLQ